MKTNYNITIGYKAVITINVKADNEAEAKEAAKKIFEDTVRKKPYQNSKVVLEDDTYKVDGILDMDRTWNQL